MKLLPRAAQTAGREMLSSILDGRMGLRLRFRYDAITAILHSGEEIGVLDSRTIDGLRILKARVPSIIPEVFVGCNEDQDGYGQLRKKSTCDHMVQITLYGHEKDYDLVGSILSERETYLQEPTRLDHGATYRNPHFLSWDDCPETPLLDSAASQLQVDFATKVREVFEQMTDVAPIPQDLIEQDHRISRLLRR